MTPAQLDQPRPALYFDDLQPVRGRRTDPQTSHDAASRAERFGRFACRPNPCRTQGARPWNAGLSDPKAHTQQGGIVIGPRDRYAGAKTQRISRAGI